jgi:hypothetical protein
MVKFRDLTISLFFISLICLVLYSIFWLRSFKQESLALLDTQLTAVRNDCNNQLHSMQLLVIDESKRADLRLETIQRMVDSRLKSLERLTDAQLTGLRQDILQVAGKADKTMEATTEVLKSTTIAINNVSDITGQVKEALPDFLDCSDANPNCLFNRWVGVSWSTEQTMRSVRDSLPSILKSVDSTAQSTAVTSKAISEMAVALTTKPPWYVRVIGWTLGTGSKILSFVW